MKIPFENTEVAFQSKSTPELKRAQSLFKMVAKPFMVKFGKQITSIAFALHLPIKGIIKKTIFKQFCGGEDVSDCENAINTLDKYNVGTILDYSVEGKDSDEDLDFVVEEIKKTILRAKGDQAIPFSVFKPTGVSQFSILEKANEGIDNLDSKDLESWNKIKNRFHVLCETAAKNNVPIFIDAEDSWIQDSIDRLCEEMMSTYNKEDVYIYTTIQFYRWDRLDYLKSLHQKAKAKGYKIGVKLVRGAYMEKERDRAEEKGYKDPIQPNKVATDKAYNDALRYCIENINDISICAGSHNEQSAQVLVDLIEEKKLDKTDKRIYFAQLLGMSDHISFNLANNGYNVTKYMPYGPIKEVMPYLIRRAEENTSVAGQTGRELSLINQEIKRRKSAK